MTGKLAIGRGTLPNVPALTYLYSRLPFLFQRVDQIAAAVFARETADQRTTPLQFHFLELLHLRGPISQIEAARMTGMDASTTSLVLGNLVKRGLVGRAADARDKRRKIVEILPAGRDAHQRAAEDYARAEAQLAAPLGGGAPALTTMLKAMAARPSAAPPWSPSDGAIFDSLGFLIRRCLQQTEANIAREIGSHDLTIRQYATLLLICFHPGIGESGLTRLLGYESSNAALVVRLLRGKGLIEAAADHDRGRKRYTPTGTGKAAMMAIEPGLTRAEISLAGGFSAAAVKQLQQWLGSIVIALEHRVKSPLILFADIAADPDWPMPLQPYLRLDD